MSAGDRVVAENYLQHAEHYNRIIAAAQAQMPIQQVRDLRDEFDEDGDDDRDDLDGNNSNNANSSNEIPAPIAIGSGPQPIIEGTPAEVALNPEAAPNANGERRPNGFHAPFNGDDAQQRRSRRSRRGGRGRPELEGGDGEPVQSAEPQQGAEEPQTQETAVPDPVPVDQD